MTIAVTIRTVGAVIFAADSKVTTKGISGFDANSKLIWIDQAYDNAYKIAHDRERRLMAMVAGYGVIGRSPATDFIRRYRFPMVADLVQQDAEISALAANISNEIKAYWQTTKVPKKEWPAPTLVIATATPDGHDSRVWLGSYNLPPNATADTEATYGFEEILKSPGVRLEGSYGEVYSLLYGMDWNILSDVLRILGVKGTDFFDAVKKSSVVRAVDKINFDSMPTQDAINLASFLANVQIQMDRFLPGEAACGGAVDVMVLELVPEPSIIPYLKTLHYEPR
jgi:hypothetical protein